MSNVFEIPTRSIEGWLLRWSAVVFDPREFFRSHESRSTGSALQFFVLNQLLAYILLFALSITFFFIFYRARILEQVRAGLVEKLTTASALFVVFVILNFVIVMLAALCSWSIARCFRSTTGFPRHMSASLDLSAFEPLAIPAFGLLILLFGPRFEPYGVRHLIPGVIAVIVARGWASWAGYWSMQSLHPLRGWQKWVLYLFGFLLQQVILTLLGIGLVSMFVALVVVQHWD